MSDFDLAAFNLPAFIEEKQAVVNACLKKILDTFDRDRELVRAMDHSLMAGGKRVRPILALASAAACNGDERLALPAACAMEMIHTYSLIHDDLPAMDDDDLRRGLPTCHKKFSEATAILAGDGLLTHAFHILGNPCGLFDPVPAPKVMLSLAALISDASGVNGMVEGQMLDMQSYDGNKDNLLDHLKNIHALKTGRMISASVEAGALSIQAEPDQRENLLAYAGHIGLSFQVMDDILNVEGDPEKMGKAAGSDALHDKMTFPAIIGLGESKAYARELTDAALAALEPFDEKADPLRAIAVYITNRDR